MQLFGPHAQLSTQRFVTSIPEFSGVRSQLLALAQPFGVIFEALTLLRGQAVHALLRNLI